MDRSEWVLVPRAPTEAMVDAARGFSVPGYCPAKEQWPSIYAAMLSAAPPPPAEQSQDRSEVEKASGEALDKPLEVFSAGEWRYAETGQTFSAADLDAAAFAVYRDRLAALSRQQELSDSEAVRPVVDEAIERLRENPKLWKADLVGDEISVERMTAILTAALAPQQPTAKPSGEEG